MNFKDILETLPSIDHLTGLDVLNGETVIHHIPAAPGKLRFASSLSCVSRKI